MASFPYQRPNPTPHDHGNVNDSFTPHDHGNVNDSDGLQTPHHLLALQLVTPVQRLTAGNEQKGARKRARRTPKG